MGECFQIPFAVVKIFIMAACIVTFCSSVSTFSSEHITSEIIVDPCKKSAPCQLFISNVTSCFSASLPYTSTSIILAGDSQSQEEIQEKLKLWRGLQNVPRCWAVVQPLLCSVYMPKCDNGSIDLPSKDLCEKTRGPCKIVEKEQGWPKFLQCDNEDVFPSDPKCSILSGDGKTLKFNISTSCLSPMVPTDNRLNWYEGVEGCGLKCQNPMFSLDEHNKIHVFIGITGFLCLVTTLFTVITFLIDWRGANKYPGVNIFFMNCCFFVASVGWLAQFTPGSREDIVCRKDGTLRIGEPRSESEYFPCIIIFCIVYFFLMAGVIWFVNLSYSWHVLFRALGTPRNAFAGKSPYFHLCSWCIPFILAFIILCLGKVDGDFISGICFVGYIDHSMRVVFVLVPIALALFIGGFFLIRGLTTLCFLKTNSPGLINNAANEKIKTTIIRLGIFAFLAFLFVVISFSCHVYDYAHQKEWEKSFHNYIICETNITWPQNKSSKVAPCELKNRPSMGVVMGNILAVFGTGIAMSAWVWNMATLTTWKRFLRRLFKQPINEPIKLQRHKMIAKAFSRRGEMRNGRLSISFNSTHNDPLGLNLDLNSNASQASSTWAAALPRLLLRRGGLKTTPLGLRRSSSDSDLSKDGPQDHTQRRLSLDSLMDEQDHNLGIGKRRRKKLKKRHTRSKINPWPLLQLKGRRGSDTSQGSFIPVDPKPSVRQDTWRLFEIAQKPDQNLDAFAIVSSTLTEIPAITLPNSYLNGCVAHPGFLLEDLDPTPAIINVHSEENQIRNHSRTSSIKSISPLQLSSLQTKTPIIYSIPGQISDMEQVIFLPNSQQAQWLIKPPKPSSSNVFLKENLPGQLSDSEPTFSKGRSGSRNSHRRTGDIGINTCDSSS